MKLLFTILLSAVLPVLTPWKAGDMDIHLIATGSGENTFIVMPDGTTMLVDAGASRGECIVKGMTAMDVVTEYIQHFSPNPDKLDYFFLTHFHNDHIAGAPEIGRRFKIGKVIDRSYPDYENVKGCPDQYLEWVKSLSQSGESPVEKFKVGSRSQFAPCSGKVNGFEIYNVAGGGMVSTGHGELSRPMSPEDPANFDENMMSCAILMRYGPFSYYTGGDLPGSNWYVRQWRGGKAVSGEIKANGKVEYRNFEMQAAEMVAPVTAMKLHHHGVPDGTTSQFLWMMRPEVILVSGSDHKQPCPATLRRIADPQLPCAHKIYVTTDRARVGNGNALWKSSVEAVGHIVLRVTDGGHSYRVFVLDAHDSQYRVINASEKRAVGPSERLTPDIPVEASADYGCIDAAADSVFRAVTSFAGTDEIHSMVVLKDGKKIYERYDTGHNANERHVMWSASKTFTAVGVGFAVQDSLLNVNDKVISFFRDDELPADRSEWLCNMTVDNLLTMSSGLGADGIKEVRSLTWQHPAREVLAIPMAFEPGSRYKYNSMNTYLLSEIVQRTTGMKLSDYLNKKLFRPLGICNWEWEESADGTTVGGWGLFTTTENLAKLGQFLLDKGEWKGQRLLNAGWIESMTKPHIYQSADIGGDWNSGYGYQVWICTHDAYRVDGAHGQFSIVIPDKNAVIAVNAQFHKGKRNFMDMVWKTIYPVL